MALFDDTMPVSPLEALLNATQPSDSGWVTIPPASGYASSAQVRVIGKRVTLRGQFTRNSGNVTAEDVGTLPSGKRPPQLLTAISVGSTTTYAKVVIDTSGVIQIAATAGGSSTYVRVDNISFLLD